MMMKKTGVNYILIISLMLFSINIIYAQLIPDNFYEDGNYNQGHIMNIANESDLESNSTNFSESEEFNEPILMKGMMTLASIPNSITVIYPEAGYYYITDEMALWIITENPSTCTYSFNSGPEVNMRDNETYHSEFIQDLADNMASEEPYVVDFYCDDGSGVISDYTYFWINTSELDKYIIRANQGEWNYISSIQEWYGEDEGLLEVYNSYYKKGDNNIYDEVDIFIFTNRTSLDAYIKKYLVDEYGSNLSVKVIGGKNFYTYYNEGNFTGWSSGNYFVLHQVYAKGNSTPVSLSIPNDVLNPYLLKYPNDLRNGICGDGKVNVLNLEGKKEECDKNQESVSCGINIGECKPGQKVRKCNANCTWQAYGACNATTSKTEVCYDNKDNDCDGFTDENCERFLILSPNKSVYNTTSIIISLNATIYKFSKMEYSDLPNLSKFTLLCYNCTNFSKKYTLKEGNHTLVFNGILTNGTRIINQTKFIIDTKLPTISTVKPTSMKYTNGSYFYLKYSEDNCKSLILIINGSEVRTTPCKSGKYIEENFSQNLSKYNNQTVSYKFRMIDKANNSYESKLTKIKVDTKAPEIKNFKAEKSLIGTYIIFNMTILNEDKYSLYKVEYLDNFSSSRTTPTWKSLCTSLKPGNICYKKVYFKAGDHALIVRVKDDAGNSDSEYISVKI